MIKSKLSEDEYKNFFEGTFEKAKIFKNIVSKGESNYDDEVND